MLATFLCMAGPAGPAAHEAHYTWRERLFYAVAWTPKASVQAALSGVPLAMVKALKPSHPDYADWVKWGHEVQATGVICVLICATAGTLLTQLLGPVLLRKVGACVLVVGIECCWL